MVSVTYYVEEPEDVALSINNYVAAVIHNEIEEAPRNHWTSTLIYIYDPMGAKNPKKKISEAQVASIIEYLYAEGFIEDRKTACKVVENFDEI